MKTTYILSKMSLLLVLIFLSCTDHEISELPDVEALAYGPDCKHPFPYNVDVHKLGTAPVIEYGIVYAYSQRPDSLVPNIITDTKVVFNSPFALGKQTEVEYGVCYPYVYYRSYVVVQGGAVVYGPVLLFRIIG